MDRLSRLFVNNILVDFLRGLRKAADLFDPTRGRRISIVTWMEVLVGLPVR